MNPCLAQGCDEQVFESPFGHRGGSTPSGDTSSQGEAAETSALHGLKLVIVAEPVLASIARPTTAARNIRRSSP